MQVIVQGSKDSLTPKDYVTQGGEGKIFQRGAVAYKIYEDPSKMIPVGKIDELSKLDEPNIIRPKDIIYSSKKEITIVCVFSQSKSMGFQMRDTS